MQAVAIDSDLNAIELVQKREHIPQKRKTSSFLVEDPSAYCKVLSDDKMKCMCFLF